MSADSLPEFHKDYAEKLAGGKMSIKVWIEQGVVWNLQPEAAEGFRKVVKHAKQDVYVTSGREGDHQPDSFHYLGLAWDMRKSGFTKARLQKILGKDWDVISYNWGFHCELDRN